MKEGIELITTKEGKQIYLKKGMFKEYRVVYPMKNEDGSTNWFNTLAGGSWGYVLKGIGLALIAMLIIWAWHHDTAVCQDTMANIEDVCLRLYSNIAQQNTNYSLVTYADLHPLDTSLIIINAT